MRVTISIAGRPQLSRCEQPREVIVDVRCEAPRLSRGIIRRPRLHAIGRSPANGSHSSCWLVLWGSAQALGGALNAYEGVGSALGRRLCAPERWPALQIRPSNGARWWVRVGGGAPAWQWRRRASLLMLIERSAKGQCQRRSLRSALDTSG